MRKNFKTKRTEAALSIIVTSALVITLAIVVGSAIKKGTGNEENNNYVNLNETESKTTLTADNNSSSNENTNTQTEIESKSSKIADGNSQTKGVIEGESKAAPTETKTTDSNTQSSETVETNTPENDVPVISPTAVSSGYSFSEADTLMMPVNGEIILTYSMDNTIFFPTLNVYKCNPGMYIGAASGSQITASASGKVSSITSNEELGNIVTMDLGNGYEATYGQLSSVNVTEGEFVLAGTTIGSIDQPTIYYSVEGSGVYFSLTHNGEPENPLDYME